MCVGWGERTKILQEKKDMMKLTEYYTVNDLQIAGYQTVRTPKPDVVLLFIHGFGSSSSINMKYYSRVYTLLEQQYEKVVHSYAIDLPGHGHSDGSHRFTASPKDHVQTIYQVQDMIHRAYEGENHIKFITVGHSMGAAVAISAANMSTAWACVAVAPCFYHIEAPYNYIKWIPKPYFQLVDSCIRSFPLQKLRIDSGVSPSKLYTRGEKKDDHEMFSKSATIWHLHNGGHIMISLVDVFSMTFLQKILPSGDKFDPARVRIITFNNDKLVKNGATEEWVAEHDVKHEVVNGAHEDICLYQDTNINMEIPIYTAVIRMILDLLDKDHK